MGAGSANQSAARRRRRPRRRRGWGAIALALIALWPLLTARADDGLGVVRITGEVLPDIAIQPCGEVGYVGRLPNGTNQEWYDVFAIDANQGPQAGQIVVGSNRPWAGSFRVTATTSTWAPLSVAHGALRYSTSPPASFAAADETPALGAAAIRLGQLANPPGATAYTHYYLLHLKHPRPATDTFTATITYDAGQFETATTARCVVTISYRTHASPGA